MERVTRRSSAGTFLACIVAGPIFLWSAAAAAVYLQIPDPIAVQPQLILMLSMASLPALVIGLFLALIPCAFGTMLLYRAGQTSRLARLPALWVIAGALTAASIALALEPLPSGAEVSFGLIFTGAVCARICRAFTVWE